MKKIFDQYSIDVSKAKFMSGKGCDTCLKSGFKGRAGIHELLLMDQSIRQVLLSEISAGPIRDAAVKNGMRLMMVDGLIKVAQGVTTVEEVLAATQ
jgi:type II secretory ATPase GspE/PulE/Tfp pilus assembly ATPase PilB-like protein